MKNLRLYILLVLASVTFESFAIKLPSHSFFGANELYSDSFDNIEYSAGTQISNINILLEGVNSQWGDICTERSMGDKDDCTQCCGEFSDAQENEDESTFTLFNTCMSRCGVEESLAPLGSTLWLLLFVFAYAGVKVYSGKKVKEAI